MTNREWRQRAAARTREGIHAGLQQIVVALPQGQPQQNDTYRAVNNEAHRLLGPGSYALKLYRGTVILTVLRREPGATYVELRSTWVSKQKAGEETDEQQHIEGHERLRMAAHLAGDREQQHREDEQPSAEGDAQAAGRSASCARNASMIAAQSSQTQ